MTFAKGRNAATNGFGNMFRQAKYKRRPANLAARRALKRTIPANPKYDAHLNDIDFQIEAGFAGLMAPGQFQCATCIRLRAGRVMNQGDGIYGGVFVSSLYAAIAQTALAAFPPQSLFAKTIATTLDGFR